VREDKKIKNALLNQCLKRIDPLLPLKSEKEATKLSLLNAGLQQ
jgi:hypothetical protein